MEQRPAAMLALDITQIDRDLLLQRLVDLIQVMLQEHIFGWNRAISLKLERPMTVCAPLSKQGIGRAFDGGFKQSLRRVRAEGIAF